MELTRNEETITFPRAEWTDETGKVWSNPTRSFMAKRGWTEVPEVVHVQTVEEYNLQQNEQRRQTFSIEADPIKLNEDEYAIRENRAPDYTLWLAKKDEIRARYPYQA